MITQRSDTLEFAELLDALPDAVFWLKAIRNSQTQVVDFQVDYVNQHGRELVDGIYRIQAGTTLLGANPHDRPAMEQSFRALLDVFTTGQRQETTFFNTALQRWFLVNRTKLGDGVLSVVRDVSESQRSITESEEQANLLQTIINNSPAAIVLYEPILNEAGQIIDFRYKLVNPMAASATSRPLEYMQGNTLFTMFPVAAQKGFFDRLCAVSQTGDRRQYEHHFADDAVDLWADITMVRQGTDVLTVFQYITDLKRAQQQLEASKNELQTIIDTAQTGIFLFSPILGETGEVVDFRFQSANRQLASYVGQTPEVVVGALGSTWFPDYKTNGLFEIYRETYLTGQSHRFDFHYYGSGIDVWLDIMSTKLGDEVVVTFGDYTPLKKLQQQLETSVAELQRSNKNLEQFAYVASHDLQEPLRKIQAFGELLQTQYAPALGKEGADMIQRMQSAASRMQVLIKDILAYSRIATRQESAVTVDLNRVVQNVLSDLESAINDKQALISLDPLPILTGDPSQVHQLFLNLFSNALKFTRPDVVPTLTVSSRIVQGRDVDAGVDLPDKDQLFYLIEVADNGIGFEARLATRIFDVFQRLHSRHSYEGTGIGLAVVQKVVHNHHGYITAEGKPGEGATFRILLPIG